MAYIDEFVFDRIAYIYELTQIRKEEWAMGYVQKLLEHFRTEKAPKKKEKEKYIPVSPRSINIEFEKALASLRREELKINPDNPLDYEDLEKIAVF